MNAARSAHTGIMRTERRAWQAGRAWPHLESGFDFDTLAQINPGLDALAAKLIHTSDLLLDACYASMALHPEVARRRRARIREVLQRILAHAREVNADALLIAGGLFDAHWVTRETVSFARDAFAAAAPLPVFITPGLADPHGPGSPYAQNWPENVFVFSRRDWQATPVPGAPVVIHGRAAVAPLADRLEFSGLICPADGKLHVGLASGRESALPGAGPLAFQADAVQVEGLHYLALGGHHATLPVHGVSAVSAYYSGAPEPHSFEETGPHFFLEVTTEEGRGSQPQVRVHPVASALTQFGTFAVDCGKHYSTDQLLRAVRALAPEGLDALVRVKLQGIVQPAVREEIHQLYSLAADAFEFLDLTLPATASEYAQQMSRENTSMGIFVQRLSQALADAPTAQRKAHLTRAIEAGVAAYRGEAEPIPGIEASS